MGQKQLKKGHWHFIACFLSHGVAAQAALEAGYSKKNPGTIGCRLMHQPEILAGCLMQAIAMHAEGQGPDGRAVRQLREIVPDRLGKGLNLHDVADLPPVEEAFRQFCLALGLDQRRMMPLPMPILAGPAPDGTGVAAEGAGAETPAAPAAIARPVPFALPRLKLPRDLRGLSKPSRYKALHGGRGSGKSHVFAELLVRRCVEAAPIRAVCIREVQRSLDQSVKRLIEDKIQALGVGFAFTVQADRILGIGG